jgi:hypothetical protein
MNGKLVQVLDRHNILVTERKKADFAYDNECAELNRLIKLKGDQSVINLSKLAPSRNADLASIFIFSGTQKPNHDRLLECAG